MAIRFRQLQAFHAIYETGTVTGAAGVLGISQPGTSNLIAQLERETRFKLFERVRGRLIPTPEAGVLYQEVDTVVRGLDHVGQAITDLQNKQGGQLQVASQHALSFGFMPRLIAQFARDRPDMSISFQSQYSPKVQEWVVSGLFEIGVCETPVLYDALDVHPFSLEMVVAMHPDTPLTQHQVLTPELLAGEPMIAMGPDHMSNRRMREAFDSAGVTWTVRVHSHLFKNILSFVKEGMGVAVLDPLLLKYDEVGGFVTRPFRPRIMMDMVVVTSRDRPMSALGRQFLDLLLAEINRARSDSTLPWNAETP
ncbi:LysR substrate-binding domain-containing protein [Gymnodinialimonas ulvae]|uniref:LysR substrate-binding domain-containing protein n=1 Tax=Gymnodinialimonas ulvae TaxID=3126504 RepID=UPI00309BFFDA